MVLCERDSFHIIQEQNKCLYLFGLRSSLIQTTTGWLATTSLVMSRSVAASRSIAASRSVAAILSECRHHQQPFLKHRHRRHCRHPRFLPRFSERGFSVFLFIKVRKREDGADDSCFGSPKRKKCKTGDNIKRNDMVEGRKQKTLVRFEPSSKEFRHCQGHSQPVDGVGSTYNRERSCIHLYPYERKRLFSVATNAIYPTSNAEQQTRSFSSSVTKSGTAVATTTTFSRQDRREIRYRARRQLFP